MSNQVKFIATCGGVVCARARIVKRSVRQPVKELFKFKLKYIDEADPAYIASTAWARTFCESRVLNTITLDKVYTDENGAIHTFDEPQHQVWWIEIDEIKFKTIKDAAPKQEDDMESFKQSTLVEAERPYQITRCDHPKESPSGSADGTGQPYQEES